MATRSLLDTCVLYPATLRDSLLTLAELELYCPLWSGEILAELGRNLRKAGVADRACARLTRQMNAAFEDAEVTGYEPLVATMSCDPKDRHVLAASVYGRADFLVAFNTKDFPAASTASHEVVVLHPDAFLLDLLDLAPGLVIGALHTQAARYKREPRTVNGILTVLDRTGVPGFAEQARRHLRR